MKRSTLAIVITLTASLLSPLAANAGGNGNQGKTNNYSKGNPAKSSYTNTNYTPSSANANAGAVAGSYSNSGAGANASNGNQSTDVNNNTNLHNANNNTANGGAGGTSNVDLYNNNSNSNTNNVQGGAGGSSYNSNEAKGGNGYGGIGVGIGKGGEGGKGGQGGQGGTGGTASADNTNNNNVHSAGGTGYGGTGGTATNNNTVHSAGGSGYGGTGGSSTSTSKGGSVGNTTATGGNAGNSSSGSGNSTVIHGNNYQEATQAPQLGAPHAVPGNAGFAYNSYVCNNLQTSVNVTAGNKTSSTSGGFNIIGFGIGGGNSNSDISIPKEYAAGLRTIPLQIAAGTLGSMSTLNVSENTPAWFASMILRMSADPSDHQQVAQYNAIADQMATIKTQQIHCPNMTPTVVNVVDGPLKAVREYNHKRHTERQEARDHEWKERQNAPKPPKRYRTENVPNGNRY